MPFSGKNPWTLKLLLQMPAEGWETSKKSNADTEATEAQISLAL